MALMSSRFFQKSMKTLIRSIVLSCPVARALSVILHDLGGLIKCSGDVSTFCFLKSLKSKLVNVVINKINVK